MGAGYLDVWAALNDNDTISATRTALSPSVVYNSLLKKVVLTGGSNVVWGDILNVVWGDHILLSNNVAWGDNVVWGDCKPSGEATSIAIKGEQ